MSILASLPIELELQLLEFAPQLRFVNTHYYSLYNEHFRQRLFHECGPNIAQAIFHAKEAIVAYVKGCDTIRYYTRNIIARTQNLLSPDTINAVDDIYQSAYISDSWQLIYYLIKYRKIYPTIEHFVTQESDDYVYDAKHTVMSVVRSHSLRYERDVYLTEGFYNLTCALMLDKVSYGLGTTKFQIQVFNTDNKTVRYTHNYYPATNIADVAPRSHFVVLNMNSFAIDSSTGDDSIFTSFANKETDATDMPKANHKFRRVKLIMEETGLNVKMGIKFFYFDFKPADALLQGKFYFWLLSEPHITDTAGKDYLQLVNVLEKNASTMIDYHINLLYGSTDAAASYPSLLSLNDEIVEQPVEESDKDLLQYTEKYLVLSDENQIKRKIKFITVMEQRDYEDLRKGFNHEKLRLDDCKHAVLWRTNWQ